MGINEWDKEIALGQKSKDPNKKNAADYLQKFISGEPIDKDRLVMAIYELNQSLHFKVDWSKVG